MLIEVSMSLILNPDYVGFYLGTERIPADPPHDVIEARTFLLKIWFIMFQLTIYR
jgi:hypothetical protein